jgi:hypothetical protein
MTFIFCVPLPYEKRISGMPISVPNQTNVTTDLHTHAFCCGDEALWLAMIYILYCSWHFLLSNQFSSCVNSSYSDRSLELISFMSIIYVNLYQQWIVFFNPILEVQLLCEKTWCRWISDARAYGKLHARGSRIKILSGQNLCIVYF